MDRPKDREDIIRLLVEVSMKLYKGGMRVQISGDDDLVLYEQLNIEERAEAVERFRTLTRPTPPTS